MTTQLRVACTSESTEQVLHIMPDRKLNLISAKTWSDYCSCKGESQSRSRNVVLPAHCIAIAAIEIRAQDQCQQSNKAVRDLKVIQWWTTRPSENLEAFSTRLEFKSGGISRALETLMNSHGPTAKPPSLDTSVDDPGQCKLPGSAGSALTWAAPTSGKCSVHPEA